MHDPLESLARVFIRGSSPRLAIDMLIKRNTLAAVTKRMGEARFAELAAYNDSSWVPIKLYNEFIRSVYETSGNSDADAIAFWREHAGMIMASPLLIGIVSTGRALFGFSPMAIFKIAPRAWTLTYKNFGKMTVTHTDEGKERTVLMRITHAPLPLMEDNVFAVGHVGTFLAILDLFKVEGKGDMSERDPKTGAFTIRIRYTL